jgi:hypothetical protein
MCRAGRRMRQRRLLERQAARCARLAEWSR